jgi:hypothetical protein
MSRIARFWSCEWLSFWLRICLETFLPETRFLWLYILAALCKRLHNLSTRRGEKGGKHCKRKERENESFWQTIVLFLESFEEPSSCKILIKITSDLNGLGAKAFVELLEIFSASFHVVGWAIVGQPYRFADKISLRLDEILWEREFLRWGWQKKN